ncbi:hypothetical protein COO60DRAFT_369300 [Scenedesmus sp. NREL 46B-D3]|nr:hypothetical protein COO60DRAFT_369300 [Scenedesmus sp. NREL 46B-D3]
MARAEQDRQQQQGVRQMDHFLYAAAAAVEHQPAAVFAPAAPLITNAMLMARAEQERVEAAALLPQQQQQQAVSSVVSAPRTPAAEEQPLAAGHAAIIAATGRAVEQSHSITAAAAPAAVTPFVMQGWQQLEQQLQRVHIQEVACSQKQPLHQQEQQQAQGDDDHDYTVEEVCSWFPGVQASLKSTQRVGLPAQVASRQPDAPGFFSVLTRTSAPPLSHGARARHPARQPTKPGCLYLRGSPPQVRADTRGRRAPVQGSYLALGWCRAASSLCRCICVQCLLFAAVYASLAAHCACPAAGVRTSWPR